MNKPFHILCHVGMGEQPGRVDVRWLAYVYVDADIHVVVYQDDQKEFFSILHTQGHSCWEKSPPFKLKQFNQSVNQHERETYCLG